MQGMLTKCKERNMNGRMKSTTMGNKVFALKVTSDQMPKLEGDAGVQIATQTIDETKLVSPFCERYRPIKRDAIVS